MCAVAKNLFSETEYQTVWARSFFFFFTQMCSLKISPFKVNNMKAKKKNKINHGTSSRVSARNVCLYISVRYCVRRKNPEVPLRKKRANILSAKCINMHKCQIHQRRMLICSSSFRYFHKKKKIIFSTIRSRY